MPKTPVKSSCRDASLPTYVSAAVRARARASGESRSKTSATALRRVALAVRARSAERFGADASLSLVVGAVEVSAGIDAAAAPRVTRRNDLTSCLTPSS